MLSPCPMTCFIRLCFCVTIKLLSVDSIRRLSEWASSARKHSTTLFTMPSNDHAKQQVARLNVAATQSWMATITSHPVHVIMLYAHCATQRSCFKRSNIINSLNLCTSTLFVFLLCLFCRHGAVLRHMIKSFHHNHK